MEIRKLASWLSVVFGAILIVGSIATWTMVSSMLSDQRITTPDNAVCLADRDVRGPFTAYCRAMTIDRNVLETTDGLRYAELDREDPRRGTAQNASFLQASLFTSVLSFGVATMAAGMGLLFILIGLGMRDVSQQVARPTSGTDPGDPTV
jgi:hypothetical protein